MEQATLVAPVVENEKLSLLGRVQYAFGQASTLCLMLTVLLLPFPVRLPLVGGFGHYSLTALDAYPADFTALGAIACGLIFTLSNLEFTRDDSKSQIRSMLLFNSKPWTPGSGLFSLIVTRKSGILSFLLVSWAFLSLAWSDEPLYGLMMMARLAGGLALLLVAARQTAENRKILAGLLVAGGVGQGLIALWQFFRQEAVSLIFWPTIYSPDISGSSVVQIGTGRDFVLRAYGTLSHPNVLGAYLVITLLAALWLIFQTRGLNQKLLLAGGAIIAGGLVLSFSRSAWLGLGLSLLIVYRTKIIRFRKRKFNYSRGKIFSIVAGLVCSVILLGLVAQPLTSRLFRLDLPLERNSLDERINYFEVAFQIIRQHPLLGVGLSNYTIYGPTRAELGPAWPFPVHNILLLITGELGLVGAILWLLSWLAVLWRPGPEKVWASGVVALAVIGQFDHHPWTQPQSQMLWWLMLGLWLGNKTLSHR